MNISQVTAKDDEALEYLNVLVTVELAAEIHRDKPNTAIRKTVGAITATDEPSASQGDHGWPGKAGISKRLLADAQARA